MPKSPFVGDAEELVIKGDKKLVSFGKNEVPKWRFIGKGLNLFGLCTNSNCSAYNHEVICMKGITDKQFNIQVELELLKCSECNKPLEPHYDLGFFDCKCYLRGKRFIEQQGEKVIVEHVDEFFEAPNDKWVKFVCQNYKWKILVIVVAERNESTGIIVQFEKSQKQKESQKQNRQEKEESFQEKKIKKIPNLEEKIRVFNKRVESLK